MRLMSARSTRRFVMRGEFDFLQLISLQLKCCTLVICLRYRIARNHYNTEERACAETALQNGLKTLDIDDVYELDFSRLPENNVAFAEEAMTTCLQTLNFLAYIQALWTNNEKALKILKQAEWLYAREKITVRSGWKRD